MKPIRCCLPRSSGFPDQCAPVFDYAWVAHVRRDWPEATGRWATARARFPQQSPGYTNGAVALRELRRFDEAEEVLAEATVRFPSEPAPLIEHAWLAWAQRNWPEAAARWERVRQRFPDVLEGYVRSAGALCEMWRYDEAEEVLVEGMRRFPDDCRLANDYAVLASHQGRDEEAARRFTDVRTRFPNDVRGYLGGAKSLRNSFRLREAEAMLEQAHTLIPHEPRILLEHALLPVFAPLRRDRNYEEAIGRFAALRAKFPHFEEGYLVSIRHLRDIGRYDEADAVAIAGMRLLPQSSATAVEYGHTASQRADWPEALRRYQQIRDRFPNELDGSVGLARALSCSGRPADAEELLREVIANSTAEKAVFAEYALIAVRQNDWKEALARWTDACRCFPDEKEFIHRAFDARMRLAEGESPDTVLAATDRALGSTDTTDPRAQVRDMIIQFESLGGRGIGCEFGMFQREFGAEPLGLLRWADMPYEGIVFVLENRFEGVGAPENTELFINRENVQPEYCTTDKRGFMYQRCFIYEADISHERMLKQTLRRLPYLRDKLIADLESGEKLFVWRQTDRNLTAAELDRLHRAVQSYGNNTLLYVRYQDDDHPNGTVEYDRPGLIIGYIDRFKLSRDGELSATPASASWMAICKKAYALWKSPQRTEQTPAAKVTPRSPATSSIASAAPLADVSDHELVWKFESLGGSGHGCEFGLFQRHFGAEPLGMLRWADLAPELLISALEHRFDGVGDPENTVIFVPDGGDEWWTKDTRYWMAMRSFVKAADVSLELMSKRVCQRLGFLRQKLLEDLETGSKIFVYKNMFRNLTAEELVRLHAAVKTYGDSALFYVRYEDVEHPNGTVEFASPGLMIGYIDHFAFSPENEQLSSAIDSWLSLCRRAHQIWARRSR